MPIKLLHLSDPHYGKREFATNLHHRIATINLTHLYHWKICTGDITDNGDEYSLIKNIPFHRECPGNHDYGEFGWFKQRSRAKAFDGKYGTLYATTQKPHITIIGGKIVLIGLNSNPLTWQFWLSFARGNIGIRQRRNLAKILDNYKGYTRIVYLHHHITQRHTFMELSDAKKLRKILKNKCEAVFMGHKHFQERLPALEYELNIPIIHAAGALYEEAEALEITIGEDKKIDAKYVSII